jgi:hypothetical protein
MKREQETNSRIMKETRKEGRKREGGKIQGHVENEVVLRRLKEERPQKKKCLDISWETKEQAKGRYWEREGRGRLGSSGF